MKQLETVLFQHCPLMLHFNVKLQVCDSLAHAVSRELQLPMSPASTAIAPVSTMTTAVPVSKRNYSCPSLQLHHYCSSLDCDHNSLQYNHILDRIRTYGRSIDTIASLMFPSIIFFFKKLLKYKHALPYISCNYDGDSETFSQTTHGHHIDIDPSTLYRWPYRC
ncbi:uncharacterized protein LOC119589690 [Penaeus monodon]|uniref:uncharacterized protein LOC119589690 n=1 Tax=Penaeus monodon TaxID=6687 RepID=UPI0018A735EF|nr:uncharacterized protein LOC119589690 [Penaeus monodon]